MAEAVGAARSTLAEPPVDGDFGVRLAAPAAPGSVIVDATVPAWLRFDWNALLPGDENPAGIATFGNRIG